jgi:hypothetical protein
VRVTAFLFGTEPADPMVFAVALVGLRVADVLATIGPAGRMAVNPIVTRRRERSMEAPTMKETVDV